MANTMKLTTLRIGEDLWSLLETEAERVGVSVSQYIREAALARAAAAAGARGEAPFEQIVASAREVASSSATPVDKRREIELALSQLARTLSHDTRESAEALRGQSRQATARSEELQGKPRTKRPAAR